MDPIEKAVQILRQDGIIVYPTDTVYGLGGDALSEEAIIKVYETKRRLISKPLSIAVSSREMLYGVARVDDTASEFIDRFLPGPVTVILPAKTSIPEILTGGTGMIGIRYPAHPIALRLIDLLDSPITSTSANISGAKDPVTPDQCHVSYDFLIDAGRLPGTPSTVVDLGAHRILREGSGTEAILEYFADTG